MKVLFAPIGNPSEYQLVKYLVNNEENETNASFKALARSLKIENVIIIPGLSLCDISSYKNYIDCNNFVKGLVKEKLKLDKEVILVAPNIYGNKFIQSDRQNSLYFSFIYFNSLKFLELYEPKEVYVDITHGINYMPLLAVEAIKLASYSYVIKHKPLVIKIFNSEPIMRNNQGPYVIDTVMEQYVNKRVAIINLLIPFISEGKANILKKVSLNKEFQETLISSAYALFSGIFLYLILINDEIKNFLGNIRETLNILDHENFRLNMEIGSNLVYKDSFPMELSYIHALLLSINEMVENIKTYDKLVDVNDILSLADKFSTSNTIEELVRNQINRLKKLSGIGYEPILLSKYVRKNNNENNTDINSMKSVSRLRNFYAHAGLDYNLTYICKRNGNLYLTYNGYLDEVKRLLLENSNLINP